VSVFVALIIGYLFGARTRGRDLEQLGKSLKTLYDTDEFADVVSATRVQFANALRDVAGIIGGEAQLAEGGGDLVARVTHLVGRD
jgi:hypothetical protein